MSGTRRWAEQEPGLPLLRPRPAARPAAAWTPRQLRTRIAAIVMIGALIVVLHFTGALDSFVQRIAPPRVDWSNDYATVEHLRVDVVRRGLAKLPKQCLLFIINGNDPPTAQRMQVMQKPGQGCPATHGQLPRLFTLRVDRTHGTVETDAGSPGNFHPLAP